MNFDISNRETRDALRLGIQSAIAAAVQFTVMTSLGLPEKFVGILSAVLVVEPSIGVTLVAAQRRVVATLVGCAVGLACFFVIPNGYGTAVALAVAMFCMNTLAGFRPHWRYGVVAAVALALKAENDSVQTAIDRSIAIGLGVAVGSSASLLVWPDKASTRVRWHLHDALQTLADYLTSTLKATTEKDESPSNDLKKRYSSEISNARETVEGVRIADASALRERIRHTERLYSAVLILERVAEEGSADNGDSEIIEMLNGIRESTQEAIEALAGDEQSPNGELDKLRDQLEQLGDRVNTGNDGESPIQHALHFGLNEVEDSLRKLEDCRGAS